MKKYDHVIWDFNGTILDDIEAGILGTNMLLEERGLKLIPNIDTYRELFDFPIKDYYARLGFDFTVEPYEVIAPLWVENYNKAVKNSKLRDGVKEMMDELKMRGVRQYVLSATELNMLRGQLRDLGIEGYFEEIMGLDNVHAASKVALGKKLGERIDMEKALMIGDTTHDYDTAQAMGCDCILVAGGHQSERKIRTRTDSVEMSFGSVLQKYF